MKIVNITLILKCHTRLDGFSINKICSTFCMLKCFILEQKQLIMRSILYLIAVVLVIGWILGFFFYSAGQLIHILLIIALISVILGIIRRA